VAAAEGAAAAKPMSDLCRDLLPAFNSRRVDLARRSGPGPCAEESPQTSWPDQRRWGQPPHPLPLTGLFGTRLNVAGSWCLTPSTPTRGLIRGSKKWSD